MYRIDDLGLEECDLIHLDIEGYEEKALEGAIETIKKFKPTIVTEHSRGEKMLVDLGYELKKKLRMDTLFTPMT